MSALPEGDKDSDDAASRESDATAAASSGDVGAAGMDQHQDADIGSLIHAALLDGATAASGGHPGDIAGGDGPGLSAPIYDGHVPLVLEADILPAIDATLDLLTTSTDLFDVPSFDFGHAPGDTGDV